jgi:hypothetical protein
MRKEIEKNISNPIILALLLTTPVLIDVLNVFVQQFSLGNTSVYTLLIHLAVLIYLFTHVKIYKSDIILLVFFYFVFLINYLVFKDTRQYIFSKNMIFVYIYALPCAVISTRKIRNWSEFLEILKPFTLIATALGALMILTFRYDKYLVYMDFSYAMLPSICANYYFSRTKITKNGRINVSILYLAGFVISFIEIIVFGARAPIFFVLIYIIAFEILRADKKLLYKTVIATLIGVTLHLVLKYEITLMNYLSTLPIFSGSRLFTKYYAGKLFLSEGREQLKALCNSRIATMGMDITGFFGDRAYCGINPYPHNIVREIIMSWGWIIGVLMVMSIFLLISNSLMQKKGEKDVVVLLLISVFARYFLSGSYIQESNFYLFLFALIAVRNSSSTAMRVNLLRRR